MEPRSRHTAQERDAFCLLEMNVLWCEKCKSEQQHFATLALTSANHVYVTNKILFDLNECCISWPGLYNHLTSTHLRWFGMSWTAKWRKNSQQVLSICGNSFKTVGKAFHMKLVERMMRVCKSAIKAKGWLLWRISNIKCILIYLTLVFGYYMIPCVIS